MATKRIDKSLRFPNLRPDGAKQCVWCAKSPLPGQRLRWCSDACVEEYQLQASPGDVRKRIHARDKGICAICKIDCDAIKKALVPYKYIRRQSVWGKYAGDERVRRWHRGLRLLERLWGVKLTGRVSFWDMDHTIPLIEGGTNTMANLRTLCRKCHKRETTALAQRRKAARKSVA